MDSEDGNCATCKWWWDTHGKANNGDGSAECRRYAPKPRLEEWDTDAPMMHVNWPVTFGCEGCGEYSYDAKGR